MKLNPFTVRRRQPMPLFVPVQYQTLTKETARYPRIDQRKLMARVRISDEIMCEILAHNAKREMQALMLRQRFGMTDKQVTRVMRRLGGLGAWKKAIQQEMAGVTFDFSKVGELLRSPQPNVFQRAWRSMKRLIGR